MDQDAHIHLLLQDVLRILRDHAHPDGARAGINDGRDVIHGAGQVGRRSAGDDLRRVAFLDGSQIRLKDVRHDPNLGKIRDGEAGRRAGLQELAGRDQLLHDRSGDRRANDSRRGPAAAGSPGWLGSSAHQPRGSEVPPTRRRGRLRRWPRPSVACSTSFRAEVVVGKLLGQVGDAAGVLRGRHRLAVSADRRGVIRRGRRRQDVPGLDLRAERDHEPRDRPRDRRQDGGRLIVVEVHRAGRFNRAAEGGRLDGRRVEFLSLRRG